MTTEEDKLQKAFEKVERDLSEASESGTADVFDLYGQIMKVHTPGSELGVDFVISDLDEAIISNRIAVYTREQLKTLNMINVFLKPVVVNGITSENPFLGKVRSFMKNDLVNMAVLSRAHRGKVITAILEYGKMQQTEAQPEQRGGIGGFIDRLRGKKREEE